MRRANVQTVLDCNAAGVDDDDDDDGGVV